MCHFRDQNGPFVLNKTFLVQTIVINSIYLLALSIVQNWKKNLAADIELWGCTIFGPKMDHLPQIFFWKKLLSFSSTYWPISLCKTLKKIILTLEWAIPMRHFWAQNSPFALMRLFSENLLISLVPFIHAYLYAKNQSQILIY